MYAKPFHQSYIFIFYIIYEMLIDKTKNKKNKNNVKPLSMKNFGDGCQSQMCVKGEQLHLWQTAPQMKNPLLQKHRQDKAIAICCDESG